jgi:hypothetical protein
VRVLEIRGHHDAETHMIRIPIAVFVGEEGFPFAKKEKVMRERLEQGHDLDPEFGYKQETQGSEIGRNES